MNRGHVVPLRPSKTNSIGGKVTHKILKIKKIHLFLFGLDFRLRLRLGLVNYNLQFDKFLLIVLHTETQSPNLQLKGKDNTERISSRI